MSLITVLYIYAVIYAVIILLCLAMGRGESK